MYDPAFADLDLWPMEWLAVIEYSSQMRVNPFDIVDCARCGTAKRKDGPLSPTTALRGYWEPYKCVRPGWPPLYLQP